MAEQNTTRQAAVWKPPRLMKLALGGTRSGTKGQDPYDPGSWETPTAPPSCPEQSTYRMPTSAEPSTNKPSC